MTAANAFLALLVSANGVYFIKALIDGFQAMRNGATKREKDVMTSALDQRDDAIEQKDRAEKKEEKTAEKRDYWHRRAMRAEGELIRRGHDVPDDPQGKPQ